MASIAIYTPANMNAIDGSSVWTQTVALAIAELGNVDVTLLLSHAITTERMLGPLLSHPAVTVVDPVEAGLTQEEPLSLDGAATTLTRMSSQGTDAVVVRGVDAAYRLSQQRRLRGKLWPYLTDVPQRVEDIDPQWQRRMEKIMSASVVLLCQTEELRSFLESHFPSVRGKGRLLPPAIPGDLSPNVLPPPTRDDLRLCYSGKFARAWNTYEMCDLPTELATRGIDATLTMVGDKINRDHAWPEFVAEMRAKLESSPGVDWVGGVSRQQSIEHMAAAHVGLSWRAPELDDSLELSTKLLEYCAAGTPPVLNRNPMHERIFGGDYPLFVDTESSVLDVLQSLARRPEMYRDALDMTSRVASDYTFDRASQRLSDLVTEIFRRGPLRARRRLDFARRPRTDPIDDSKPR